MTMGLALLEKPASTSPVLTLARGKRSRRSYLRLAVLVVSGMAFSLSACGTTAQGTAVVTNPPTPGGVTATPTPAIQGVRTVMTSVGLNLRSAASSKASVITVLAQGTQVKVVGSSSDGSWLKVTDSSGDNGWISSDPTLSSAHTMQTYVSTTPQFTVLYWTSWSYTASGSSVTFSSDDGTQKIVVTQYATGAPATSTSPSSPGRQNVCGGTASTGTTVSGSTSTLTMNVSEGQGAILQAVYTYPSSASTTAFSDFANSLVFPGPGCQGGSQGSQP